MLANVAEPLGRMLADIPVDQEELGIIGWMADFGAAAAQRVNPADLRRTIVREAAPGIARMVARDLDKDPRARRLIVQSYLTGQDPMREYREVAAFDYLVALQDAFPDEFASVWEEDEDLPEGAVFGFEEFGDETDADDALGNLGMSKKFKKKLKKVGKVVAIGAAVVGAVALGVVTGGAAIPAIAAVATTGFQMSQAKKKAKAEKKAIKQAEAELAALNQPPPPPPPGEIAPTTDAAFQATQAATQGMPVQQAAVGAQQEIVGGVIPQAMASYAAGQVAGKTPQQIEAEYGVPAGQVDQSRLQEAEAVAAGAEPTASGTPGWVLPVAAGGGGLLLALATGVI
jgi:hypothetical protein